MILMIFFKKKKKIRLPTYRPLKILKCLGFFACVPTRYVTENKEENYLEIYIFQVSCPLSFKHRKLPISIKIPVTKKIFSYLEFDSSPKLFNQQSCSIEPLCVCTCTCMHACSALCLCTIRWCMYVCMHN